MKILAGFFLAYTAAMLLIHVSTAQLLKVWGTPDESWMQRQFPPQRALRVEAVYWAFALIGWTLWPSPALKAMVVAFAAIHLGIWAASELRVVSLHIGRDPSALASKTHRLIVAFDLVEACALVAMAWFTVAYLLH